MTPSILDKSKLFQRQNMAAVVKGPNQLVLENKPVPVPGRNQVLVKMHSVGICGSDVHILQHGRLEKDKFILKEPNSPGHESSGTVVMVGEDVKHLVPGDRVALEPGVACRMCKHCKNGYYNRCPKITICSLPPTQGNMCRYFTHESDFCHKIPDSMSFEEGAMLEPLAVGVYACNRGQVGYGKKVLICGAGAIGQVCMMSAKVFGAQKTIITDVIGSRLELTKKLGADHTVLFDRSKSEEEMANAIKESLGDEPEVAIECSGQLTSIRVALRALAIGGTLVLVGICPEEASLPLSAAGHSREISIVGSFRYGYTYPVALQMVADGLVDVQSLVTHRFKLEECHKAFQTCAEAREGTIKVVVQCFEEGEEKGLNIKGQ